MIVTCFCNQLRPEALLFFAVYVIYKKNCSFSRVVFLFFQTKTANSFYSKINDSSGVRTTKFSSGRFGVRVPLMSNFFYDLSLAFFDA